MSFIKYIKKMRDGYIINQVKNIQLPNLGPSPMVRYYVVFSGRVQNVGFRLEIYELAKKLNLTGWVKNRTDRKVETEIQGEIERINFLIQFMKSLKRASVQDVMINEIPLIEKDNDFTVIRE